jgi:4-hydroxybenzoate polyprenyltransferase
MNLRSLVRWDEWRDTKVPLGLVALFYAALAREHAGAAFLGEMVFVFVLLCVYGAFGHMINDYSDREADLKARKRNAMAGLSPARAKALIVLTGVVGLLPALYYRDRPAVIVLLVASYAIAWAYSMPPLRFKERDMLGLVAPALAQRTLPPLVIFAALGPWDHVSIAITVAGTLLGLRYMLVHQIADYRADVRAGLRTFGVKHGQQKTARVIRVLFPFEAASLAVAVFGMGWVAPAMGAVGVLYILLFSWRTWMGAKVGERVTPVSYGMLSNFYVLYWPVSMAAILAWREPLFAIVLVLTLVSQLRAVQAEWITARKLLRQS